MENTYGRILVRYGVVAIDVSNQFKPTTLADFAIRVVSPTMLILEKNRGSVNEQVFSSLDEVFGYIRAYYDFHSSDVNAPIHRLPIKVNCDNLILNTSNEFEVAIHQFLTEVNNK